MEAIEQIVSDGTTLTGTFDHKQTILDLAGLGDQLGQMFEPGQAPDVGWLVDDGFDAERSPFFEVLLDAAVLVGEVHLDFGARAEDPGAELFRRGAATPVAAEHGMNLVWAADADVVGDKRPGVAGDIDRASGDGGRHRAVRSGPRVVH